MSNSVLDPRRLLEVPWIYNTFQKLAGAERTRREFVAQYIAPLKGQRVLDVGCGPATNLNWWPEGVQYVGCDLSDEYIEFAKKKFGNRGEFYAAPVGKLNDLGLKPFDAVIAMALLHHLTDDEVRTFCDEALSVLKPGGMLITLDPSYADGDSWLTRLFTSKDRGRYVRTAEEYQKLLGTRFVRQTCHVKRFRLFLIVNQSMTTIQAFRD